MRQETGTAKPKLDKECNLYCVYCGKCFLHKVKKKCKKGQHHMFKIPPERQL